VAAKAALAWARVGQVAAEVVPGVVVGTTAVVVVTAAGAAVVAGAAVEGAAVVVVGVLLPLDPQPAAASPATNRPAMRYPPFFTPRP
jgi:hypothetical protein